MDRGLSLINLSNKELVNTFAYTPALDDLVLQIILFL